MMNRLPGTGRNLLLLAVFLALLMLTAMASRALTPIDETRYVSVAWEMWLRGDFLVPFKNGHPYSDKPPMLFWLYQLGWSVLGVNGWWPRMVSPLASLAGLFLTTRLARLLAADKPEVAVTAPWILASSLLWVIFSTSAMFDVLLTVWALFGVLGVLLASRGAMRKGFFMLALAIGLGVLAKGPVILLHVLPLAVLAPWWSPGLAWKRWYGSILLAVLGGAAIALAWAIPAAIHGGPEFQRAIFWGQTADRMVDSFAHRRPVWWYLPLLPLLLYPWFVWPGLWTAIAKSVSNGLTGGMKFCLAWMMPVFLAFCFISGKQVHYLVPLFPAFALFSAQALAEKPQRFGAGRLLPALLLLGVALISLWYAYHGLPKKDDWAGQISPWTGSAMLAGFLVWVVMSARLQWLTGLVSLSFVFLVLMQVGVVRPLSPAYDVTSFARQIADLQNRQVPVVQVGKYQAQYQFAGRLQQPLEEISPQELSDWFVHHPDGRAIIYVSSLKEAQSVQPDYLHLYRGEVAMLINREALPLLRQTHVRIE